MFASLPSFVRLATAWSFKEQAISNMDLKLCLEEVVHLIHILEYGYYLLFDPCKIYQGLHEIEYLLKYYVQLWASGEIHQ